MVDDLSRWAGFELLGLANFGTIWSKLGRSVADVVVVAVAWLAAVGAPCGCGRSIVPFGERVWTILLPVELGRRVRPAKGLMSIGHRGSS